MQLQLLNRGTDVVNEFQALLNLCLENNIVVYRGKKYKFPDLFPMNGPLSSLAANFFMDALEHDILEAGSTLHAIHSWWRCVDDIFCVGRVRFDVAPSGISRDLKVYWIHDGSKRKHQ